MNVKVILVVFIKGGVGKFIIVVNFGVFCVDVGLKIFFIDLDFVQFFLFLYYEFFEVVQGGIYDLFVVNIIDLVRIIFRMIIFNLDVVIFNDQNN